MSQAAGGRDVGTAAQVDEGIGVAVVADLAAVGHLAGQFIDRLPGAIGTGGHRHRFDDLPLIGVVGEQLQPFSG